MHNRSALGANCVRTAQRRRGASLVPEDVEVGALRVSVTGWDGWVLEGLRVSAQSSVPKLCSDACSAQADLVLQISFDALTYTGQ